MSWYLRVSQPHSLTVSPHHSLTASQPHSLTVSQPHRLTVSQPHRLTVSPSHRLTSPQSHSLTMQKKTFNQNGDGSSSPSSSSSSSPSSSCFPSRLPAPYRSHCLWYKGATALEPRQDLRLAYRCNCCDARNPLGCPRTRSGPGCSPKALPPSSVVSNLRHPAQSGGERALRCGS